MEIFGLISTALAVVGVIANNRKLRWCFLLWMVSNAITLVIHTRAGIWSLALRDVIFLVLAVEGWIRWGAKFRDGIYEDGYCGQSSRG